MATRVLNAKYYWPTLIIDNVEYVKRCIQCQKHGNLIHQPVDELLILASSWQLPCGGMLGPFPLARGQCMYLLVAIDCFKNR